MTESGQESTLQSTTTTTKKKSKVEIHLQKVKDILSEPKGPALSPIQVQRLKKLVRLEDMRLEILGFVTSLVKVKGRTPCPLWMKNILIVVKVLTHKDNFKEDAGPDDPVDKNGVRDKYVEFRKGFTALWSEVMRWKMDPNIYKQVVTLLPERVMDHLTKPLHMSDFLLESFKMGGAVSLLSLHGIFTLMQKYNFDVPDFYTKLYSMFTPEVLYCKYRARFFAYSQQFLSSTHLPEYLVGAFVKKMARLALHAPAPALPMLFDFITNLLIEHPGLKTLVNKRSAKKTGQGSSDAAADASVPIPTQFVEDPFDNDEPDPNKSRALESCLWEIKTLQNHWLPSIALSARFISKALPKVEKDLDDTLSLDYDDIYEMEVKGSESVDPISKVITKITDPAALVRSMAANSETFFKESTLYGVYSILGDIKSKKEAMMMEM